MKIKPCYPHILFVGKQRCGKDLLILHDIYNIVINGRSIFHKFLIKENLDSYSTNDKVYSNCFLDSKVFNNHFFIKSVNNIEDARGPALIWIHDADLWFDSRNIFMNNRKDNSKLLHLVNNMGKLGLSSRISCHRRNSLDVKLRQLMNLKVVPRMICHKSDRSNFKNWSIHFKVFDEYDILIGTGILHNVYKIAHLYNTEEIVCELL